MQKKEQKTHLEAGADRHERTYDAFSGIPVQRIEETNQSSSLNLVIPHTSQPETALKPL